MQKLLIDYNLYLLPYNLNNFHSDSPPMLFWVVISTAGVHSAAASFVVGRNQSVTSLVAHTQDLSDLTFLPPNKSNWRTSPPPPPMLLQETARSLFFPGGMKTRECTFHVPELVTFCFTPSTYSSSASSQLMFIVYTTENRFIELFQTHHNILM